MKFILALSALAAMVHADVMKAAKLRIKPNGYDELPEELRTWLGSKDPADQKLTQHI